TGAVDASRPTPGRGLGPAPGGPARDRAGGRTAAGTGPTGARAARRAGRPPPEPPGARGRGAGQRRLATPARAPAPRTRWGRGLLPAPRGTGGRARPSARSPPRPAPTSRPA